MNSAQPEHESRLFVQQLTFSAEQQLTAAVFAVQSSALDECCCHQYVNPVAVSELYVDVAAEVLDAVQNACLCYAAVRGLIAGQDACCCPHCVTWHTLAGLYPRFDLQCCGQNVKQMGHHVVCCAC